MARIHLLIIDPQYDFMDYPDSSLPVTGADADMKRLAAFVKRVGHKLDDIHVTLDSHQPIAIFHPGFWVDQNGQMPAPFTQITADDAQLGIWRPRNENARLPELNGLTIGKYVQNYTRELESTGKYKLIIWPEHCLIGSKGHNVHADLFAALNDWARNGFGNIDYVAKGTNAFTEHYGAMRAEVPLASDPFSDLNTRLLDILATADYVVVAGEALDFCVKTTVDQTADYFGPKLVSKLVILQDATSAIYSRDWLKDIVARGAKLSTTVDFLA